MKKSDRTNNTNSQNISSIGNQTEGKLQASEERFRLLCEAAEEGIIVHDNGIIIEANQAMARMFGYELSELIGKNAEVGVTSESWKVILDNAAAGYDKPYEITGVRKDGSTFICSVVGKPYKYQGRSLRVALFRDVTERKKAEELLQKSEARYRLLADNMTEHVWLMDLNLQTTYISPSVEKIYGYTWKEMLKLPFKKILTAESLQKAKAILSSEISNALANPPHHDYKFLLELECRHKDGHLFCIEDTISFIQDENGKPLSLLGETRDITERKLAEESLRKSEAQYRLLADHMKDQVWIMDLDLKITYISPSVERLMGYTLEEIRKLSLDKILTATSLQTAIDFFSVEMPRALAAPSDYILNRSLELEFIRKNGQTIWGETSFSFIRDENGNPLSVLGESRNITERKKMEESLQKSEENFRHSLDDSPLGVHISTIEGETIYANRAILDIYGYDSLEELKYIQLKERYTPQSFAEFQIRKAKRVKGEFGPSEYEINIVRKDGEIRHLYVFRKEIFWNGRKQSQVIYQDITLRRQAEEKLSATLENLRRSIRVTIQVLGTASEARDPYTAGHQKRVANLARAIATEMKLPHDKIEAIRMAAAIHDIGKISVPSEILCKPSMLTNLEFSIIKAHPEQSYEIIKDVESPWPLADIVRQHHERMDGSGYPLGLKNKDILIEARILAVADVVEAMMSYRPYRPALGVEIALAEIENNTGTLYDRDAVDACLRLFRVKNYQIT